MMISPVITQRVAIIGGGFAGSLFALRLAAARPEWTILLIEKTPRVGRGVAYGACKSQHLLNVPTIRMEVGLSPSFRDWLKGRPSFLQAALNESKGVLDDAFVPRELFGDYIEEEMAKAVSDGDIQRISGEAVGISAKPRQVILSDGTRITVDKVILATGNLPSRLPFTAASSRLVDDPWKQGVFDQIHPDDSILLLGTGLTMVDTLLILLGHGHKGPLHAVSRHGLLPRSHRSGGYWPPVLETGASPRAALRAVVRHARKAELQGIPWQRVFDAVRPVAASLWHSWNLTQRAQFLRHLRTWWDVHRHRMAERIAAIVNDALWNGSLTITAGRVLNVSGHKGGLIAVIKPRGAKPLMVEVDAILNCTGPAGDLRRIKHPLLQDLQKHGLVRPDVLGLGLDTDDCAVLGADGKVSDWLFALGSLTRPAWWEITAVPEIRAQVERLVNRFHEGRSRIRPHLADAFLDIGAGI